jgi:hypothetical protein
MAVVPDAPETRLDPAGPWLAVQALDLLNEDQTKKLPVAVVETVTAHDVACEDIHPAVEDPKTLLARTPNLPPDDELLLETFADVIARRIGLPDQQAVRVTAYPDLLTAHAAVGDRVQPGDG